MTDSSTLPAYGIYGTGGCGRSVLPVADRMLAARHGDRNYELVFIDDTPVTGKLNGRRVLSPKEFAAIDAGSRRVSIAVADPRLREDLAGRCAAHGLEFFSVAAQNVVVMDDVQVGEGSVLSPFVTITSNVRIGRHFQANLYSYVEHDCRIGDFVTFAPSVCCNGCVVVEDRAYLGAGCVVRQGTPDEPLVIGEGAVVGMGAVVTRSVAPGATVVGNPARPLKDG